MSRAKQRARYRDHETTVAQREGSVGQPGPQDARDPSEGGDR